MTKKYFHLSQEQRYQIEANLTVGISAPKIANQLGVHKSTIYREIKRNSTVGAKPPDKYKAKNAQLFTKLRQYKPTVIYTKDSAVIRRIQFLLNCDWSPEQIYDTCKLRSIPMMSIEAIYLWIYNNRKSDKDYTNKLRRYHRKRRKRRLSKQSRVIIKDKISIHERSEVINKQERFGDWEADLVKAKNGYIVNITERKSLFNLMEKVATKDALSVQKAIVKALLPYKNNVYSITSDNGTEFANHKTTSEELAINWYFADAYKSQQRGCNENQNGLIRQYIKRDTDLSLLTDDDIKKLQNKLNNRPRKKNNFLSPKKTLTSNNIVALTS
jgi:IS30 family transposase